jgi:hypothetical protein
MSICMLSIHANLPVLLVLLLLLLLLLLYLQAHLT